MTSIDFNEKLVFSPSYAVPSSGWIVSNEPPAIDSIETGELKPIVKFHRYAICSLLFKPEELVRLLEIAHRQNEPLEVIEHIHRVIDSVKK
jgi:hypothetical protein